MPSQCIHPCKCAATSADVVFNTHVDFGVTLKVVLSNEALLASIALVLPVTEMCLNMCTYILTATKLCVPTAGIKTLPLVCYWVLFCHVIVNEFGIDARRFHAAVDIEVGKRHGTRSPAWRALMMITTW